MRKDVKWHQSEKVFSGKCCSIYLKNGIRLSDKVVLTTIRLRGGDKNEDR